MPEYFPDQPIVRGRDVIYRPAGNAGEYAPLAINPWFGCGHKCLYCYVPNAMHQDRKIFNQGAVYRDGFTGRLIRDVARHQRAGIPGGSSEQIFITFASDAYHPGPSNEITRGLIEILQEGGLAFCTLSKGGHRALPFIDMYRRERDAYAATLTTLDAAFSRKWEQDAALPWERLDTLRRFHDAGIFTWASLEPTLDVDASIEIVKATHEFVNHFKIGKANYLKEITRTTDWEDYTLRMIEVCQALDVSHYIKRDLQEFLPPGYYNPLRVKQHHG